MLITDLFDTFGIPPQTFEFALAMVTTNLKGKCYQLSAMIEDGLMGAHMTSIQAPYSTGFFTAFTMPPKVEKAYEHWQEGTTLIPMVRRTSTRRSKP